MKRSVPRYCEGPDVEILDLTERLFENDVNNCAKYLQYDIQQKQKRHGQGDLSGKPLFSNVDGRVFSLPTVEALLALHDNYTAVKKINPM